METQGRCGAGKCLRDQIKERFVLGKDKFDQGWMNGTFSDVMQTMDWNPFNGSEQGVGII